MKPQSRIFLYFLIIWGILNLIQASFTPLHNDEAYYWMYSRYPAWGYYDHPPMIAIIIRAGYMLLSNELGVRLFIVLSQIAALCIIWNLLDKEKKQDQQTVLTLILMISVLPVLNIYGFFAAPDSPLLLFTALFLFFYKRFIDHESRVNTIALGITMAGLMYSKYQGAIMLLLIILSNLKLLKTPKFYIASFFALILFIPHISWQISNDFPSIRYHLSERAAGFDIGNVPEYLLNQLLIHNPLILPLFLFVIFRTKIQDTFEKGLKYIVAGFFIFFFVASFRYSVQPQWTALITIPLLILYFNHADSQPSGLVYLRRTALFIIPLMLFARLALMIDFLPVSFLKNEFHNNKPRMEEIEKLAGDRPVVFTNSYQNPSVYTFYTGKFAHTLNNKDYRKTQYDLWPFEEMIHGKEVLYLPHWLDDYYKANLSIHKTLAGDTIYYRIFKSFQSLQKKCVIFNPDSLSFSRSTDNNLDLRIFNPYNYELKLDHPELPVVFQAGFYNRDGYMEVNKNLELPGDLKVLNPGDTVSVTCTFRIDELSEGDYKFVILSEVGILYNILSSRFSEVTVRQ
jgi:hypothetical protein